MELVLTSGAFFLLQRRRDISGAHTSQPPKLGHAAYWVQVLSGVEVSVNLDAADVAQILVLRLHGMNENSRAGLVFKISPNPCCKPGRGNSFVHMSMDWPLQILSQPTYARDVLLSMHSCITASSTCSKITAKMSNINGLSESAIACGSLRPAATTPSCFDDAMPSCEQRRACTTPALHPHGSETEYHT